MSFCTGWEVSGFHSMFDCVIGSTVLINQAGKAVSGWTMKRDSEIVGGSPPVLHDITTLADKADGFVTAPFSNNCNEKWRRSVRGSLTASLLRSCDDFIEIIFNHPSRTFERINQHPFVSDVKKPRHWCVLMRQHGRVGVPKSKKALCRGTLTPH